MFEEVPARKTGCLSIALAATGLVLAVAGLIVKEIRR